MGTMIEVPRGAMTADEIATEAQFFSFGTNDLTQMAFGFSRDDAGKFLRTYREHRILDRDPFASLDVDGVGQLVRLAVEKGRRARPDLNSAFAASTAETPPRFSFLQRSVSTTSAHHRIGFRPPAWRQPTRRCGRATTIASTQATKPENRRLWARSAGYPQSSPVRSRPARSWSVRPRWSRNLLRTP